MSTTDYHHLTYDLRCQISALKKSGLNRLKIANQIETSQSTISRELRRNGGKNGYN